MYTTSTYELVLSIICYKNGCRRAPPIPGCFAGFSTLRLVARGDLEATKALTGRGGRTGRDEMRKAP